MARCLIVDDIEENLYMLQIILESQGYEVTRAKNGKEALESAIASPPDIIVSDILMPVMDGFNLCREWKKHQDLAKIPFIFYTATYTEEKDREFALNLGADLFLVKPTEPDILLANIRKLLELYLSGQFKPSKENPKEEVIQRYNETLVRKLEKKMRELEQEIASRKQVEENLRISEERFKLATKSGLVGVWDWNIKEGTFYIEPYLKSMLGYEDSEIPNSIEAWNNFIHPDDKAQLLEQIQKSILGESTHIESTHRVLHKDGTYRWFLRRGHVLKDKDNKPFRQVGITMDVTDSVQAQKEINMLAHALKTVQEFVCITAPNGTIKYINDSMVKGLGYERADLMGAPIETIFLKKGIPAIQNMCKCLRPNTDWQLETILNRRDGSQIPVLLAVSASEDISLTTWILTNLTEMKEKEKQLRFAHKMETIGTMVSGIAHDFNNILLAIYGNTELALMNASQNAPERNLLNNILQASNRAKNLVNQLLTISRGKESERKPIDVYPIIQEVDKLIKATMPSTIQIITEIESSQTFILADAIQIHQVLVNLCTNASHAMEAKGGTLKITATDALLDESEVTFSGSIMPGHYLKISISDTGVGIPVGNLEKIFEPFYSTKMPGRGTGLGLSVVHGIVKSHEGWIRVESEPGVGSTFEIFLPLCKGVPSSEDTDSNPVLTGSEYILYVDDEEMLTEMLEDLLGELGYKVSVCSNSLQALEFFSQKQDELALVITDLTMPSMTGLELAKQISRIRPSFPVILCSGNKEKVSTETMHESGVTAIIHKPFSILELSKIIREVLDR